MVQAGLENLGRLPVVLRGAKHHDGFGIVRLVVYREIADLAIEMDPGLSDSYINRGIVFRRLGDLKRALSDVAEAKRIENLNRNKSASGARAP